MPIAYGPCDSFSVPNCVIAVRVTCQSVMADDRAPTANTPVLGWTATPTPVHGHVEIILNVFWSYTSILPPSPFEANNQAGLRADSASWGGENTARPWGARACPAMLGSDARNAASDDCVPESGAGTELVPWQAATTNGSTAIRTRRIVDLAPERK